MNEYMGVTKVALEQNRQAREDHRTLLLHEVFWRDHQVWLAERGYMLRPRYKPGWKPSWEGEGMAWMKYEDGIAPTVCEDHLTFELQTSFLT